MTQKESGGKEGKRTPSVLCVAGREGCVDEGERGLCPIASDWIVLVKAAEREFPSRAVGVTSIVSDGVWRVLIVVQKSLFQVLILYPLP